MRLHVADINECIEGTSDYSAHVMLCATISRVPTTVRVNQDILEMDELAKVKVTKVVILIDEQGIEN